MIIAIGLDSEGDRKNIMNIMLSHQRHYKLFCSGTIESIAQVCGANCSRCHEIFQQPQLSEMNGNLFMLFALESRADTLELLCNLTENGLTKVQTSANITSFLNSRQPICTKCARQEDISCLTTRDPSLARLFRVKREFDVDTDVFSEDNYHETARKKSRNIVRILLDDLAAFSTVKVSAVQNQPVVSNPLNEAKPLNGESSGVNTTRYNRNIEIKKDDTTLGQQQCQVCKENLDVVTSTPFGSQKHAMIHLPRAPFTCRICDYECHCKQSMDSHFLDHHAGQTASFIDVSSHPDFIKELNAMTKQCFTNWVPPVPVRGRGRPKKKPIS